MAKKSKNAKAATVEPAQVRLSDLHLSEEIHTMKRRADGLYEAIYGMSDASSRVDLPSGWSGVLQLATDLSDQLEGLERAFEAERQLRLAEGR
jgi:hypothetical protein